MKRAFHDDVRRDFDLQWPKRVARMTPGSDNEAFPTPPPSAGAMFLSGPSRNGHQRSSTGSIGPVRSSSCLSQPDAYATTTTTTTASTNYNYASTIPALNASLIPAGRGNLAQFCGSICMIWLNPWNHAKSVLDNQHTPASLSPLSHPSRLFVAYVKRILQESDLSPQVSDLALLLICRFRQLSPQRPSVGKPGSELRIVVSALMVANKMLDDTSYSTAAWVQFSRLPAKELKRMEMEFLNGLQYRTHVSRAQWTSWSQAVRVLYRASDSINYSI